jgi:polyphosphate kinase
MAVEEKEAIENAAEPATNQPLAHLQPTLDHSLYLNREWSLLEFHARVLDEALDERLPLLERTRFLAIFSSNLDEFFTIRVAGIREQMKTGVSDLSLDGMTPTEEMEAIRKRVLTLLEKQCAFFEDTLRPALAKHGIEILNYENLSASQKKAANDYFNEMVFPVCTPLAVDPGHPFPHISNLSLNLAVELQDPDGQKLFARVKVPNVLPRLVALPDVKKSLPLSEAKGEDVKREGDNHCFTN